MLLGFTQFKDLVDLVRVRRLPGWNAAFAETCSRLLTAERCPGPDPDHKEFTPTLFPATGEFSQTHCISRMPLSSRDKLVPYEILEPVGAGGGFLPGYALISPSCFVAIPTGRSIGMPAQASSVVSRSP